MGKRNIIHQLLEEYDIQTAEDIQEALKDLLGGTMYISNKLTILHGQSDHLSRRFRSLISKMYSR